MATGNQECSVSCLHNRSTPSNQEGKIFSCILFCEIKFTNQRPETPVEKTPIIPEQPQDSLVAGMNEEVGFSTGNISSSPSNIEGKVVPGIQTSEGAIINQVAQIDEKKTMILDLPPEVMHMIFDCLLNNKQERRITELRSDWCTAVCLGLVSQSFYNILKRRHPIPLLLSCKEVPNIKPHKDIFNLASLLKNFMGPRYRMIYIEDFGPLFLNRDIYGDCESKRERNLHRRWHYYWRITWWKMRKNEEHHFKTHVHRNGEEGMCTKIHILPRPLGMGKSWYKEAVASILATDWNALKAVDTAEHNHPNDPHHFHFKYGILAPLLEFLKHKRVAVIFKNMLGEGWREWLDLMDFPLVGIRGPISLDI
jgi:hypothetical protein